jgi:hypothetical protein
LLHPSGHSYFFKMMPKQTDVKLEKAMISASHIGISDNHFLFLLTGSLFGR